MAPITRGGNPAICDFLPELRLPADFVTRGVDVTGPNFKELVRFIVEDRPPAQNFWPGLSLSLVAFAESVVGLLGVPSLPNALTTHPPQEGQPGGAAVNTLNVDVAGTTVRLRAIYESVGHVIAWNLRRSAHPHSPPHNTQAWPQYRALIDSLFEATPEERSAFGGWIWLNGLLPIREDDLRSAAEYLTRPFTLLLDELSTAGPPAGAMLQGMAFGYLRADSPGVISESHKVNTGGRRANTIGDIDGFRGGEVVYACEVKDFGINAQNVEATCRDFLSALADAPNATPMLVASTITTEARDWMVAECLIPVARSDLALRSATWDIPKQEEALRGLEYYLARIQKSPALVGRLRRFLADHELEIR